MKTKIILVIILSISINVTVEAQDPTQKVLQGLLGSKNKKAENLPDTYTFDWEFKTNMEVVSNKKSNNTNYDMNFLLNTSNDYYGMQLDSDEMKKMGSPAMIYDFKSEALVMFMSNGGQNRAMIQKLKDPANKKITDKDLNYTFKEVGTKTILGYECYGMQVENKNSIATLYFTLDAPVSFSAFFAFSSEAAPKGFSDPELFNVLKEEALLMEMEVINKKKKNEKMIMTAISIEKKKMEYHKKDYQFMKMGI